MPANIKTVTMTATPVLTRLATSAEHESTSGGRNLAETVKKTFETIKNGAETIKTALRA
jgi:hypothetical protein